MKKFKYLIILLLIIITSGCTGTYNLKFNTDMSVEEELNVKLDYSDDTYEKSLSLFQNYNIDKSKYKVINNTDNISIIYKEKYDNLEDYLLNSKLYKQFYNNIEYKKEKNDIDISTTNNFNFIKNSDSLSNSANIDYFRINIINPYKVKYTNADEVQGNSYSWNFDKNTKDKNIKMEYKLQTKKINIKDIIVISLTILSLIIIIVYYFINFKKSKKI